MPYPFCLQGPGFEVSGCIPENVLKEGLTYEKAINILGTPEIMKRFDNRMIQLSEVWAGEECTKPAIYNLIPFGSWKAGIVYLTFEPVPFINRN